MEERFPSAVPLQNRYRFTFPKSVTLEISIGSLSPSLSAQLVTRLIPHCRNNLQVFLNVVLIWRDFEARRTFEFKFLAVKTVYTLFRYRGLSTLSVKAWIWQSKPSEGTAMNACYLPAPRIYLKMPTKSNHVMYRNSPAISTMLTCWIISCLRMLKGLPRNFSMIKNNISPPSAIGIGSRLTKARLTEINPAK